VNGVYSVVVTGTTGEVTLDLMTSSPGYIFETAKVKSGPLYVQTISMDLTPIENIVPGISKVIRPLTYVTPEGAGVSYISLTPSICEIKLDVMVLALSTGTCTIKAIGNPSSIIQPGAFATASFKIVAPPSILTPKPSATASPSPSATSTPKPSPSTQPQVGNLVVSFNFAKYEIKKAEEKKLRALLTTVGVKIKVTGYAQKSKSQPDIAISLDRAIEVKKAILKLNPTAEVSVIGLGNKPTPICRAYKNKCAVISIKS
jgi:outer membrane protein OmpA-like peptidoglycan-associated protein